MPGYREQTGANDIPLGKVRTKKTKAERCSFPVLYFQIPLDLCMKIEFLYNKIHKIDREAARKTKKELEAAMKKEPGAAGGEKDDASDSEDDDRSAHWRNLWMQAALAVDLDKTPRRLLGLP